MMTADVNGSGGLTGTHVSNKLAWFQGRRPLYTKSASLRQIHQMNRVSSRNGFAMMTTS